eukprot:jgi/Ulvmu1/5377/UM022_0172.1
MATKTAIGPTGVTCMATGVRLSNSRAWFLVQLCRSRQAAKTSFNAILHVLCAKRPCLSLRCRDTELLNNACCESCQFKQMMLGAAMRVMGSVRRAHVCQASQLQQHRCPSKSRMSSVQLSRFGCRERTPALVRGARLHARAPDEIIKPPPPLQVEFSRLEDNIVRLVITVPAERTEAAHSKIVAALRKDYNVPGFRNNEKVPIDMLVQAAGGEKQFNFACVEEVMNSTIEEAFKECPDQVIDGSMRVESDAEKLVEEFTPGDCLQYVVRAEAGNLGLEFTSPYTGLDIEVDAVLDQNIEDTRVENAIDRLLRERGGDLSVAQRGARMGDTLIIDFDVSEQESGNKIEGMERERHELDCISESNFLPGVMPQMMGMQVGEIRNFDFTFPDPWEPEQYAGLAATVKVKLREVLEWNLPELTLEICKSVKEDVESIEQFKSDLREAVRLEAAEELQARIHSKILEGLAGVAQLARIPEDPFERFAMGRYESRLQEAVENGFMKQEELKEYTEEAAVRGYIQANRPTLEKEFTVLLAVDEIFKREGLQADEAAITEQLESRREDFKKSGKIVTMDQVKEFVSSEFEQMATMEFLQKNANVTVKPLA